MATAQENGQAVRDALERALSSPGLARTERLSRLLRFLVERKLEDREDELKESLIGVEVFGRKPDYNPKLDSTVRSEAARLRARLAGYYENEGRADPLVIELPKGGYVPRFREVDDSRTPAARSVRSWLAWALVGTAVLVAAGFLLNRQNVSIPLAVLPFVNLSADPANEYFADGLTAEIIREISGIDGLAVRSQTSSFTFKGKPRNLGESGRLLNADYILEGSVLRAGEKLRINAQLVRVRDDLTLWSGGYDRELTDILAIQDEISRGIVNSLRLKLGHGQRRYATGTEAYDLYLHAQALRTHRFTGDPELIALFEKAVAKDSSLAPAYAGLAESYVVHSSDGARDPVREDAMGKMRMLAERAIQLDPLLAEAHIALGMACAREGQWDLAERSFHRALEIDPNSSSAHDSFARFFLWPLGRMQETVREMRTAARNDPLSPLARFELGDALLGAGRYDEAAEQCGNMPADFELGNECLARARVFQGRTAEAIKILSSDRNWGYLAYAFAKAGRREEAERTIEEGPQLHPQQRGAFQYALAFAGSGDKDRPVETTRVLIAVWRACADLLPEPTPSPRLWAAPPGATPTRLCQHSIRVLNEPSK